MRAWIAIALLLVAATDVAAQRPEAPSRRPVPARDGEYTILITSRRLDIQDFVKLIAGSTNRIYLFDETLRGIIHLVGIERVTRGEGISLLNTALYLRGYAAVPTPSGAYRIIKLGSTPSAAPWSLDPMSATDEVVTTLVSLEHASAEDVSSLLRPWIGAKATVFPFTPTNSLILAGSEDHLSYLLGLVRAFDQTVREEIRTRHLRHSDAAIMSAMLLDVYSGDQTGPGRRVRIWPDERTNSLVLQAPVDLLDEIEATLDEIDQPAVTHGQVRVIPVRYANPEELANTVAGLGSAPLIGDPEDGAAESPLVGRSYRVVADAPSKSLLVTSDRETLEIVIDLIEELDRMPPVVSIDVLVTAISLPSTQRLAFEALIPLFGEFDLQDGVTSGGAAALGGGGLRSDGSDGESAFLGRVDNQPVLIPVLDENGLPVFDEDGTIATQTISTGSGVMIANSTNAHTEVLMHPNLTMLSGDTREIFAGDNIPIPVQSDDGGGSTLTVRRNIERHDVGLRLRLTPIAGAEGVVHLELDLEISNISAPTAGDPQRVGPTLGQRHLTTKTDLGDGQIALIGGLTEKREESVIVGTPYLMDIPFLGVFFRSTQKSQIDTHFLVVAQATILRSPEELLAETIRQRVAFERSQARVDSLESDAPYALRVATRTRIWEAEAVARYFSSDGRTTEISRWEVMDDPRYDVYLTGFPTLAAVGEEAVRVRAEGWRPEVVPVPLELR